MRHETGVISTDTKEFACRVVERPSSVTIEVWLDGLQVDSLYVSSATKPFDAASIADNVMEAMRGATRVKM